MKQNNFGQIVFDAQDLSDLIMQGHDLASMRNLLVDQSVNVDLMPKDLIQHWPDWRTPDSESQTPAEFHKQQQSQWHMPPEYLNMDIAAHVLGLCDTEDQLQRCGAELLLFQERDLFDLLRYLKYLVDVMQQNHIVWGVGRGSSVASYVLYKLGVHRIDSMYYDLDPVEFLR
jgi:DNA polymerase III alpha subunit